MLSTSKSLLQRVRRLEAAAWERLCALYGPIVYGWCRRAGLQDTDALDAVQEVFRSVFQHIEQFQAGQGGGRFRGWLGAIAANCIRLHYRQAQARPRVSNRDLAELPANLDGPPSSEDAPEGEAIRQAVIRRALELVRTDFTEQTWLIFVRTTLQEQSCQDVAIELGLSANAVRQARFRVLRRLRQELDGLI